MRIIDRNNCYVQIKDIMFLLKYDDKFPMELYYDIVNKYSSNINQVLLSYVKIENEIFKQYIINSNLIFDFDYLMSKSIEELNEISDEIIRNYHLNRSSLMLKKAFELQKCEERAIDDVFLKLDIDYEKKRKDYLLSQIKEVELYRLNKTNIIYPNIINKNKLNHRFLDLVIGISYQRDKILIANADGSEISADNLSDFAIEQIVKMYKYELSSYEFGHEGNFTKSLSEDSKYIVIELKKMVPTLSKN